MLDSKNGLTDWIPWFRAQEAADKPWLFCFPYAGGGSWVFSRWPAALGEIVRVLPLVAPGREHRLSEEPLDSIREMAARVAEVLGPWLTHRLYIVFGHSLGALVAFELVRAVQERRLPLPRLLVLSGSRAPWLPRRWQPIHFLPEGQFEQAVEDRFGPIPLPLRRDRRTLAAYLRILRADLKAVETYDCQGPSPISSELLLCGGHNDPFVPVEELLNWAVICTGRVRVEVFPGGHFFLRENSALFLSVLKKHLQSAIPAC